jgi:hypothetical protein
MGKSEKSNIVRMAEFSRMCNVSRVTITKHVQRGNIILTPDRMVDLDNVANKSFLRSHLTGGTATRDAPKKTTTPVQSKKTATKKTPEHKQSKPTAKQPETARPTEPDDYGTTETKPTVDLMAELEKAISDGDKEAEEKTRILIDRAYYEALKIKNDAELKAIQIDQKNGTLAEREIIEGLVLELNKTIQEQFFNCVVKQSVEICARLGKVGFEQDVQEVLATDNSRRVHEVKRVTARFLWDRYIKPVTGGENPYIRDLASDGEEVEE